MGVSAAKTDEDDHILMGLKESLVNITKDLTVPGEETAKHIDRRTELVAGDIVILTSKG